MFIFICFLFFYIFCNLIFKWQHTFNIKISAIILNFRVFAHIATTQRSRSLGMATTRKLRIIANILIIKLRQHFNRRQSRILKQKSPQKLAYIYHHIFSPFAHNRITVFKSKIHYGGRDNGK